jgi:hypothetical protein
MTQYPFSQTRRFEAQGGYTRYAFDREVIQYFFDPAAGSRSGADQRGRIAGRAELLRGIRGIVGDNSFFGFTSPVAGQRWRVRGVADVRHADFPDTAGGLPPLCSWRSRSRLAFRGLHYGRYGRDADGRAPDGTPSCWARSLFLGYEPLIRGYCRESFEQSECVAVARTTQSGCPAFERLFGTRVAWRTSSCASRCSACRSTG